MTEYPVFRESSCERSLERIDVVDPLADERTLAEQVLVNIGDGARIRVDAGLASEQPRIALAVRARKAHCNARLQDAIALGHHLPLMVEVRTIQRVRHRAHKLTRRITR